MPVLGKKSGGKGSWVATRKHLDRTDQGPGTIRKTLAGKGNVGRVRKRGQLCKSGANEEKLWDSVWETGIECAGGGSGARTHNSSSFGSMLKSGTGVTGVIRAVWWSRMCGSLELEDGCE